MIVPLLTALALAAAVPVGGQALPVDAQRQLDEAAYALSTGRSVQAKTMLAEAVRLGAAGEPVDRILADLRFAEGNHDDALALSKALLAVHPDDLILLERAGLSALALGRDEEALAYLARAGRLESDRWRTYNGLGVLADRRGDWPAADAAYARAEALVGDVPTLLNNRGWSLVLQGKWDAAIGPLTRAVASAPDEKRYRANLEFAEMAVDHDLPAREPGESDEAFSARLNDAGVAAAAQGLEAKAIAAFTQALEARSQYYRRAADNLARVKGDE